MSDYSKSDLREIERALSGMQQEMSRGTFGSSLADKIGKTNDLLERVISRLDDISRKLDKR